MTEPPPVIEFADHVLGRLAGLDLTATEHVHACLLETTEPAEVADLARAYAKVSRCVRQTLACHSKLKHDRERAAREAERHAAGAASDDATRDLAQRLHGVQADERYEQLRDGVDRVISKAADGDEAKHTQLAHRFDRELDDWMEAPDWLERNLDAHVREACRRLGLPPHLAQSWRTLPQPTFWPDPEEDCEDTAGDAAGDMIPIPHPESEAAPPEPGIGIVSPTPRRESG